MMRRKNPKLDSSTFSLLSKVWIPPRSFSLSHAIVCFMFVFLCHTTKSYGSTIQYDCTPYRPVCVLKKKRGFYLLHFVSYKCLLLRSWSIIHCTYVIKPWLICVMAYAMAYINDDLINPHHMFVVHTIYRVDYAKIIHGF